MTKILNVTLNMAVALAFAALLSSCQPEATPPVPQGLAQVGDALITATQLQQKLAERQRRNPFAPVTIADRDAALDEMVQFEALYAQAQRGGWHTNAELLAGFKRAVVARFKEDQLAKNQTGAATESEIKAHYHEHAAQFTRPEQTRAAVILIETPAKATPEKRAEISAWASEVRELAVKDAAGQAHFGHVAQRHSIDQVTRYAGGDFGLLTLQEIGGRYGEAFARALAALKSPGDISPVVETPRGLGFVKLIERRAESRRPLSEVRDGIAYQLTKAQQVQAERDLQSSAKRGIDIRINRALLDTIALPVRQDGAPSSPGAETAQVNH